MRCIDLIEALPSHCRGAGFEFDPTTGKLDLTVNVKRVDRYRVVRLPFVPEPGVAVRLNKLTEGSDPEGGGYVVFVAQRAGHDHCECKGFIYSAKCKHVNAVRAMKANGWI